jgi:tight adherence protein B
MITTFFCLGCAALAAWLAVGRPTEQRLRTRLDPASGELKEAPLRAARRRHRRRSWIYVTVLIILLTLIIATGYLANARGAVLACAAFAAGATVARLITQHRRRRSALRARGEVAQACTVLASYLRVGQVPSAALAIAAADCQVLREGQQARTLGGDVIEVWRQQSGSAGHSGLLELARAWQGSIETGAPMSSTLDQVAVSLAADQALTRVIDSELATARATSKVMAALPACGVGIGYLLGGDPGRWLLAGPSGWACLLVGVLLACAGVLWIDALARQASGEA